MSDIDPQPLPLPVGRFEFLRRAEPVPPAEPPEEPAEPAT